MPYRNLTLYSNNTFELKGKPMNLSTFLILMTLSFGLITSSSAEPSVTCNQPSPSQIAIPITKMEGYERYLNDPDFDLSVQRIA